MRDDDKWVFSRSKADKTIEHQIEIYHELQRKANRMLRLIVAIVAVFITLISTILSRWSLQTANVILNHFPSEQLETTQNGITLSDELWMAAITGGVVLLIGFFIAIRGIIKLWNVATRGFLPYIPDQLERNVKLVATRTDDTDLKVKYAEENSKIICDMKNSIDRAYKDISIFMISVIFSLVLLSYVYSGRMWLARILMYVIVFIPFFALLSEFNVLENIKIEEKFYQIIEGMADIWQVMITIFFTFLLILIFIISLFIIGGWHDVIFVIFVFVLLAVAIWVLYKK